MSKPRTCLKWWEQGRAVTPPALCQTLCLSCLLLPHHHIGLWDLTHQTQLVAECHHLVKKSEHLCSLFELVGLFLIPCLWHILQALLDTGENNIYFPISSAFFILTALIIFSSTGCNGAWNLHSIGLFCSLFWFCLCFLPVQSAVQVQLQGRVEQNKQRWQSLGNYLLAKCQSCSWSPARSSLQNSGGV